MVLNSSHKMSAPLDEADMEVKTPMKRLGSTRKLLVFNNIRLQLNEQLKCLDARVEAQAALAGELQDYFRRRADVEADYSRGLDKLAKTLQLRHKEQKHKREQWPLFSSYACWQQLVGATRALARDHAALADLYGTRLVARFQTVAEDVQRLYRRCREIGYETHEEILRVLGELHAAMKTHQQYAGEWRAAVAKLRAAHAQRSRALPNTRTKKMKVIDKEIDKRRVKHAEAKLKALKARSEYLLCLEAANTTIHKYFVDDLSDLIDCMDLGFHNCISRALRMQASADEGRARALQQSADTLYGCIDALDSRLDKQKFLEAHHQAFMIPRKLSYQGQQPEEEDAENAAEIINGTAEESLKNESETMPSTAPPGPALPCDPDEVEAQLKAEMEMRLGQLEARVRALRAESSEACKTLETAEATLLQMVESEEWDTSNLFGSGSSQELQPTPLVPAAVSPPPPPQPEQIAIKARADRHETEEFYLTKFREYLVGSGRIARLESKAGLLRNKLGSAPLYHIGPSTPLSCIPRHRRRVGAGRGGAGGATPRLFAAPLEEHLEAVRRELPLVVTSCIRVINLYGLQHQGIFRVSGSQVEIATLREWFERGEDPLAGVSDASDINSVAGLLKLYLRELRPPLVPIIYFDHLVELSQLESKCEFVHKMREFVVGLPRCSMVLLRYLFAFLNHLSEFSEENMMDPWNLAICFGPTLVPVPEDKDQVQYQNQVNDLIKNIIILHEGIFPRDGGPVYEKYQTLQAVETETETEIEDMTQDTLTQDDVDSETSIYASEDECTQSTSVTPSGTPLLDDMDSVNAIIPAIWGWKARSNKEISVRPGDKLEVLARRPGGYLVRCLLTARQGFVPESCLVPDSREDELVLRKSPAPTAALAPVPSSSVGGGDPPRPASSPPATWPRPEMQLADNASSVGVMVGEGVDARSVECARRSHAKSHSVGDVAVAPAQFSLNKELWQQRASCQLKHTPDLVMDLPAKAVLLSEVGEESAEGAASPTTFAERFVQNQNNTLKKRPTQSDAEVVDKESYVSAERPERVGVEGVVAPAVMEKSPVPPRNTRRVAAKFADLTLTGGSLKPQTPTTVKVGDFPLKPHVAGSKPALLPRPPAAKAAAQTDNTQL